jgi:hypothetical protein
MNGQSIAVSFDFEDPVQFGLKQILTKFRLRPSIGKMPRLPYGARE